MPEKTPPVPWDTDAKNVFALHLMQGQVYGWPLFQLLSWKLTPHGNGDLLRLAVGEAVVLVEGFQLRKIVATLEQGHGGKISEQGERFAALAPAGQLFIKTITVEEEPEESAED